MYKHFAPATPPINPLEKKSVQILVDKMGLTKKEIREISDKYGVSAAQLVERMQLSKYRFVYAEEEMMRCAPCTPSAIKRHGDPGSSMIRS